MAPLLIGPLCSRAQITVNRPATKSVATVSIVRMPTLDQSLLDKVKTYQKSAAAAHAVLPTAASGGKASVKKPEAAQKEAPKGAGAAAANAVSPKKLVATPVATTTPPPDNAATIEPLSIEYTGPCDPLGRPIVMDGLARGAPKGGKKKSKSDEKAAKFAAKQAAKAAAEAEAAAKPKEPKKEKAPKEKKEVEVVPEVVYTPGEKKDMSAPMLNSYAPKHVEAAWDEWWAAQGYYRADENSTKERFVMMLPPPNVTGTLHIGHALTCSIQDTIARWRRMKGYNVLWLPGTDHAGIATQVVVEKKIKKERGLSRHDLGREAFIQEVWKWKEQSGGTINNQLRRLGASLDWSRNCFTMDDNLSKAVKEAFLRMHEKNLIYRAQRLVNWDAQLKSAVSDLEVDYITFEAPEKISVPGYDRKVDFGMFWEWAYQVEGSGEEIVIATTRPETMFGDTAVAVHPEDPRYKSFHGKNLVHPVTGRKMPIVLDAELVDMDFGTGAVKVTPAHDPNDFVTGQKHKLEFINILNDDGTLNANCGEKYNGMHRFKARFEIIKELTEKGLFKGTKPNPGMRLGVSSRTKDVIEPVLKPQWWVDCKQMAADALECVEDGRLSILPAQHKRKWHDWLGNIRDWCISRQLWWGHRIPAFYTIFAGEERVVPKDEKFERWVVANTEEEALAQAKAKFPGQELTVLQDEDVLDTWFSSGLFPFSTIGWPDHDHKDLKAFYPNTLLETGWDILFFWVARMVMMGMTLMGQVPFSQVFLHAMVRDAHGRKMSKSLGNVIDPLDVIQGIALDGLQERLEQGNLDPKEVAKAKDGQKRDFPQGIPECGTDALRFALAAYCSQGRDINLNVLRVEGYRHFCNKLWNATKFGMTNLTGYVPGALPPRDQLASQDRWILSKLQKATEEANKGMLNYDFGSATTAIYSFFLYDLCDVYLELCKPVFGSDPTQAKGAQAVLYHCIEEGLRLLHPFMPFVTEELWQRLARRPGDEASIMISKYPETQAALVDEEAESDIKAMLEVVGVVRSMRDSYGLKPSQRPVLYVRGRSAEVCAVMTRQKDNVVALAKTGELNVVAQDGEVEKGCGMRPVGDSAEVHLVLKGMVDLDAEIAKLEKSIASKTAELAKLKATMSAASWDKVPSPRPCVAGCLPSGACRLPSPCRPRPPRLAPHSQANPRTPRALPPPRACRPVARRAPSRDRMLTLGRACSRGAAGAGQRQGANNEQARLCRGRAHLALCRPRDLQGAQGCRSMSLLVRLVCFSMSSHI